MFFEKIQIVYQISPLTSLTVGFMHYDVTMTCKKNKQSERETLFKDA